MSGILRNKSELSGPHPNDDPETRNSHSSDTGSNVEFIPILKVINLGALALAALNARLTCHDSQ